MEYGELVVAYQLTKEEVQKIERELSGNSLSRQITLRGQRVWITDVQIAENGYNVQYFKLKGRVTP